MPYPHGAHLQLAAEADRIGTRLTSDNVMSNADHVVATHNSTKVHRSGPSVLSQSNQFRAEMLLLLAYTFAALYADGRHRQTRCVLPVSAAR